MSAIAIKQAIQTLLSSAVSPPLPVPRSTLTAPITGGAGTLTAAITPSLDALSRNRFVEGSRVTFNDAGGERTLTVLDVPDTLHLTFDFSALSSTGFVASHTNGTALYSNIVAHNPAKSGAMLGLDDPVFSIVVRTVSSHRDGMGFGFPLYAAHIQSNRRLSRPQIAGASIWDEETWWEQCENNTIRDMESIRSMLLENQELITPWATALTTQLAPMGQNGNLVDLEFGEVPVKQSDAWHYVGIARVLLLAGGEKLSA